VVGVHDKASSSIHEAMDAWLLGLETHTSRVPKLRNILLRQLLRTQHWTHWTAHVLGPLSLKSIKPKAVLAQLSRAMPQARCVGPSCVPCVPPPHMHNRPP